MCKRKNLFFLLHIHDEVPKTKSKVRLSFEIHKKSACIFLAHPKRSNDNFMVNMLGAIAAYCFLPEETDDKGTRRWTILMTGNLRSHFVALTNVSPYFSSIFR